MQVVLTPVVAFLSVYNHDPSPEHLKDALCSLWYVYSTLYLGNALSYADTNEPHAQIHNPFTRNKELYIDSSSPTLVFQHELTSYSDT